MFHANCLKDDLPEMSKPIFKEYKFREMSKPILRRKIRRVLLNVIC